MNKYDLEFRKLRPIYDGRRNGGFLSVVERAPHCRMVSICPSERTKKTKKWLAFPYTQFYVLRAPSIRKPFTGLYVTWTSEPLHKNSKLYLPLLPNIFADFAVCLGDLPAMIDPVFDPIDAFWSRQFVGDRPWAGMSYAKKFFGNYHRWEQLSKKNKTPDWILRHEGIWDRYANSTEFFSLHEVL